MTAADSTSFSCTSYGVCTVQSGESASDTISNLCSGIDWVELSNTDGTTGYRDQTADLSETLAVTCNNGVLSATYTEDGQTEAAGSSASLDFILCLDTPA